MTFNYHLNDLEDVYRNGQQNYENQGFLNDQENKMKQLNLILKKTKDEIELVRFQMKEQRQQLIEKTKRKNELRLNIVRLKQQIQLLKMKQQQKYQENPITTNDTSETELFEEGNECIDQMEDEETEYQPIEIENNNDDEIEDDENETEFELFESSHQKQKKVSKEKKPKKKQEQEEPPKIPQLQYQLHYTKLLKIFHSELKNRQNISLVNNFVAIESRNLFSEYCKQNNLTIPSILDTSNSTRNFYKTNVFLFNRGIKRLEEIRQSKGMKPLLQLGNNGRYPCILYVGFDKLSFI